MPDYRNTALKFIEGTEGLLRTCNDAFSCLSLQVLTVADLGLNLSQNFTISWMY